MSLAPLIDTHCHLDFDRYAEDRAAVIARAAEAGVMAIVNPSVSLQNSAEVVALAAAEPLIYAGIGIHPNDAAEVEPDSIARLRALGKQPKIVAIGEIGLDYYWTKSPTDVQQRLLEAQLALAAELELPVIIHNRESTADVLAMLGAWVEGLPEGHALRSRPGVLHSFSGGPDDARRAAELGFYVGITGPVTFRNADTLREVVRAVPENRLLIETDGPFLTPHPHRGQRNEPAFVHYVADRIAAVRVGDYAALARQTTTNAIRLFDLPLEIPPA